MLVAVEGETSPVTWPLARGGCGRKVLVRRVRVSPGVTLRDEGTDLACANKEHHTYALNADSRFWYKQWQ